MIWTIIVFLFGLFVGWLMFEQPEVVRSRLTRASQFIKTKLTTLWSKLKNE